MTIQRVVFEKAKCFINGECVDLEIGKRYKIETADVIFKNMLLDEMDNTGLMFFPCDQIGEFIEVDYEYIIEISEVE